MELARLLSFGTGFWLDSPIVGTDSAVPLDKVRFMHCNVSGALSCSVPILQGALGCTHKYILKPLLCLACRAPMFDKLMKLAQELPTKRGRTEGPAFLSWQRWCRRQAH